ncbi:hypothetical protein KUCAC02_015955 [Chaenocephalus aceratus]|uniref:Uncharacterized protein n=1 Tax=Chaenocephalus aceratus TaxID=36190 RepID=A0ACB9Y0B6_CHAAC|nr:hypothetical protein KUCAC02_015955 [Chaenocephalus aceratus]
MFPTMRWLMVKMAPVEVTLEAVVVLVQGVSVEEKWPLGQVSPCERLLSQSQSPYKELSWNLQVDSMIHISASIDIAHCMKFNLTSSFIGEIWVNCCANSGIKRNK